jgi:Ca2+-binding EF-hand superfamily protein
MTELKHIFKSFGLSLSETEMQQMFMILDADNSGTVSLDELIEWKMNSNTEDKVGK